ncbi:MAG: YceI family protein [Gemmatimonadaceae bacterium]
MRRSIVVSLAGLLVIPAALAFRAATTPMQVEPTSRLWVKGTSSVRGFECQAPVFDAQIVSAGPDAVAAVLAGTKGIGSVTLTIPADKLDCRNGTMTGHMLKAIKAADNATITFNVGSYSLTSAARGVDVTLEGTLTLGGVAKEVTINAAAKTGPDGALQVTGTYELNMRDYGLKPPSLMLGTMRVHDKVTVGFDFLLKN